MLVVCVTKHEEDSGHDVFQELFDPVSQPVKDVKAPLRPQDHQRENILQSDAPEDRVPVDLKTEQSSFYRNSMRTMYCHKFLYIKKHWFVANFVQQK